MFITEDEIDATLTRGGNVEGGKGRIYAYFTEAHNTKEKVAFLKNEYGTGGSSMQYPAAALKITAVRA
ncbi:MAG: hypothetical protein ACOX25_03030 [Caldicoprobacterales bacterium]